MKNPFVLMAQLAAMQRQFFFLNQAEKISKGASRFRGNSATYYAPNGARETGRRRRQIAAGILKIA